MSSFADFLDYYFSLGIPIAGLSLLLTRLKTPSFAEALKQEALWCGANPARQATLSSFFHAAYCLFFWPVGVAHSLLTLLKL